MHGTTQHDRIAFSLIEVLVAVLILSLGLLGLGAVFPVVIAQQRAANDATLGVATINSARSYLESRPDVNVMVREGAGARSGYGTWLMDPNWSPAPHLWEPWNNEVDRVTGDMMLAYGPTIYPAQIGIGDRLWPPPDSQFAPPQYVWDIVGRRMAPNELDFDIDKANVGHLQLAIFVRRIDPGIRVPKGKTLLQVITGDGVTVSERRVPVAVDLDGFPTFDGRVDGGRGVYAAPIVLAVTFDPDLRDRITLNDSSNSGLYPLAEQAGQRLIDNLGNIYTVVGVDEDVADTVLIEPSIPLWVGTNHVTITQVLLTPQVPADVAVFDLVVKTPEGL